jgi:hypothetical protein
MDEAIGALVTAASASHESIEFKVAFHAIYDTDDAIAPYNTKEPLSKVVTPSTQPPIEKHGWFSTGTSTADALEEDLLGFYKWAIKKYPTADNYIVFFWGHSFGPAGLFASGASIVIPSPSLRDLGPITLKRFGQTLTKATYAIGRRAEDIDAAVDGAPSDRIANRPDKNVPARFELALFQDCWMSTLETAFELQDVLNFAIASQSVVPFGHYSVPNPCLEPPGSPGAGVWPYSGIFSSLIANDSVTADLIDNVLYPFFSGGAPYRNTWPDASVPMSLLDLTVVRTPSTLAPLLSQLVEILCQKKTRRERHELMRRASPALATRSGCPATSAAGPTGGCAALVDLRMLCDELLKGSLSQADIQVVTALRDTPLVKTCKEAIDTTIPAFEPAKKSEIPRQPPLDFKGISFFYYPDKARIDVWEGIDDIVFTSVKSDSGTFDALRLCSSGGVGNRWFQMATENF